MKFRTKGAVDFVTQKITIAASGTSGWHTHPGVVLVTVASGALVRYHSDCAGTTLPAGAAFTESGRDPALVRNESATEAVVYVTYLVPAGTSALRVDADNPGCPGLS